MELHQTGASACAEVTESEAEADHLSHAAALEGNDGILQDQGHPTRQVTTGAQKIDSTLIYTQLVDFEQEDEFTCRTAKTLEEASTLIEAGFEYVTDIDDIKLFRKQK